MQQDKNNRDINPESTSDRVGIPCEGGPFPATPEEVELLRPYGIIDDPSGYTRSDIEQLVIEARATRDADTPDPQEEDPGVIGAEPLPDYLVKLKKLADLIPTAYGVSGGNYFNFICPHPHGGTGGIAYRPDGTFDVFCCVGISAADLIRHYNLPLDLNGDWVERGPETPLEPPQKDPGGEGVTPPATPPVTEAPACAYADGDEIVSTLALFANAESPATEISAFQVELDDWMPGITGKSLKTVVGYWQDHRTAGWRVKGLLQRTLGSCSPSTVYFGLNPYNEEIAHRSFDEFASRAEHRVSDADITRLRYLLVDLDPVRAADISSTDEQHGLAIERAKAIGEFLDEHGIPPGVLADSGNGGHRILRLDDLAKDVDNVSLLHRTLQTLDQLFSDDRVKVDLTTYNPARLTNSTASFAAKGRTLQRILTGSRANSRCPGIITKCA